MTIPHTPAEPWAAISHGVPTGVGPRPPKRPSALRRALVAAGLIAALAVGVTAYAQSTDSASATSTVTANGDHRL